MRRDKVRRSGPALISIVSVLAMAFSGGGASARERSCAVDVSGSGRRGPAEFATAMVSGIAYSRARPFRRSIPVKFVLRTPPKVRLTGADAVLGRKVVQPSAPFKNHLYRTDALPGNEYGVVFTFPNPGCWTIRLTASAEVRLKVGVS